MIIHFRLPVFLRVCARPRVTQCTCLKNITQEKLDVQEREEGYQTAKLEYDSHERGSKNIIHQKY